MDILEILRKYNGEMVTDDIKLGRRSFKVTSLPRYLLLSMKRFTKNRFFVEKNNTIVTFPMEGLELKLCMPAPLDKKGRPVPTRYVC